MLYKKIGLDPEKHNIISFVGGGGKTTAMNILGQEFKSMGKKVLLTTTTMIFHPEHKNNDEFILGDWPDEYRPKSGTITLFGKSMLGEKIKGPEENYLKRIWDKKIFDIMLIEADGANRKPITAPADYEPSVIDITKLTIGIIGLDSIGRSLDEDNVHRSQLLKEIFNVELPYEIQPKDIIQLILNEKGLFKNAQGERIILLNKADNQDIIFIGKIIKKLLEKKNIENIYITNLIDKKIY